MYHRDRYFSDVSTSQETNETTGRGKEISTPGVFRRRNSRIVREQTSVVLGLPVWCGNLLGHMFLEGRKKDTY